MVFPYPGLWAPGATSRSGLLVQFSSWWLCKVSQYFPQELLGKLLVDHQALETMVLYLEAPVYSKWVCLKIEYPQNFIKFHGVYCISSFSHTFPIHIFWTCHFGGLWYIPSETNPHAEPGRLQGLSAGCTAVPGIWRGRLWLCAGVPWPAAGCKMVSSMGNMVKLC